MDDTHLGRHEAGKTSAFTCHETQRQCAADNRKINCAFQASVTFPPEGRSGEAGRELVEKTRDEKQLRHFGTTVIKISLPIPVRH